MPENPTKNIKTYIGAGNFDNFINYFLLDPLSLLVNHGRQLPNDFLLIRGQSEINFFPPILWRTEYPPNYLLSPAHPECLSLFCGESIKRL